MKYSAAFGLALIAATYTTTPAFAGDGRISVGGSLGFANSDFDNLDTDSETYIEIFSRYKLPMGLAFDFAYVDFGTHSDDDDIISTELEADGFSLQAGYFYDASELVTLYARAGYFMWDAQAKATSISSSFVTTTRTVYDDSGSDLTYGLGIDFNLTENFSLGGFYQHYDIDDGAMDTYAVTGAYYFN